MLVLPISGISKKAGMYDHSGTINQTEVVLLMNLKLKAADNEHKLFEM